jgi:molybdate transport system substrate-binding protein
MERHMRLILVFGIALFATSASADQLQVVSVGTVAPAMRVIIPAFEQAAGHSVQITFGNPGATVRNLTEKSSADVGLIPQSAWNEAKATGAFDESQRVLIAKTKIGLGVRQGSSPIDVTDTEAIKAAMTRASAVCMGDPNGGSPASVALFKGLDHAGIADQVRSKAKYFPTGEKVGEAVAHGACEIGVTTLSELRAVPGIQVLGALPSDLADFASVTFALPLKGSQKPDVARQFVDFLSSTTAKDAFAAAGLDPDS